MKAPLFEKTVDGLLTLLEEGARASKRSVHRFIEPMQGTLRRAKSKRHHLVFGRRGSGKSSLLYKSATELTDSGFAVAYVDLEPFKGHHYPDVLVSVLLVSLGKFHGWLHDYVPGPGKRQWYTLWIRRSRSRSYCLRDQLLQTVAEEINELKKTLHLTDDSTICSRITVDDKHVSAEKIAANLKSQTGLLENSVEASIAREVEASRGSAMEEQFKRSKIDYLHRKILDYQAIFGKLAELTGSDCYLFLDDMYHLVRTDQPQLLDYFHRIAKGHSLWIKVGTIRHRSSWYVHTPQPVGLKIGDDAEEINLDMTLERFSTSRTFLSQVLDYYVSEAKAPTRDDLLSDGGLTRLVIASGGVTRDFLGIFRRAVEEARERLSRSPDHARGDKISAEDVNMAAGSYGDRKKDEFKKDTLDDQAQLDEAFQKIRRFCLEKIHGNVFLVDQEAKGSDADLVQELIDLRLVHHVKSRVTISSRPGEVYRALLLDVSQYMGERKRRDIEMVDFWKDDRELLRKASLIYDAAIAPKELDDQIKIAVKSRDGNVTAATGSQPELGLKIN